MCQTADWHIPHTLLRIIIKGPDKLLFLKNGFCGWLGTNQATNQSVDCLSGSGCTPTKQSGNWMNSSKCTYEKQTSFAVPLRTDYMSLLSQNGSEQSLNGLVCELQLKKGLQSFILWLLKQSGSGTCLLSTWSDKSTDPCRSCWSSSLRSVK